MWTKKYDKCVRCGTIEKKHQGRGYCSKCYWKRNYCFVKRFVWSKRHEKCIKCGTTEIKHEGLGLCIKCYWKQNHHFIKRFIWSKKYEKCVECGTTEIKHESKGLCKKCYLVKFKKENPNYHKIHNRIYAKKNREKNILLQRENRKNNPLKFKEYSKRYNEKHKEDLKKRRILNKEKIKIRTQKYRKKHPEMLHRSRKINPEKYKEEHRLEQFIKRHNSPRFKLKCNVSTSVWRKLKLHFSSKNKKSTWDFLPYSVEELIEHLEKLFLPGMTWENYGKWHLDHKRPDCSFNYNSMEDKEFQCCWALSNLQPLWAKDNLKKNGRWDKKSYI